MNVALLGKLVLAAIGVAAIERSLSAYRARRRDPAAPSDHVSDWGWRLLGIGGAMFLVSGLSIQLIDGMPKPLQSALFVTTGAGVAIAFVGASLAAWRAYL